MTQDTYKTVRQAAESVLKIKGSQFIGHILAVHSREEAEAELNHLRKTYHDATHNCYAYRIGISGREISRFSDDGEPSGTAGRPILQALQSSDVTDVLLVVTRYFGGTKLGTGGLTRAYSQSAQQTLENAGFKEVILSEEIHFSLPYDCFGLVQTLLDRYGGRIGHIAYDKDVAMQVFVRRSKAEVFRTQVTEQSNGRIKMKVQP